jgi:predicted transcriptional regulator
MSDNSETVAMTSDIVSAFVSNNAVVSADLPTLIHQVYRALAEATTGQKPREEAAALTPAVPIKKSITPEFLISLEDGKKYKSLKRHLSTRGMTPDEYRAKWGLPRDYPMVAASYSAQRSQLAKSLGLGQGGRAAPAPEPEVEAEVEAPAAEAPRRGRRKTAA